MDRVLNTNLPINTANVHGPLTLLLVSGLSFLLLLAILPSVDSRIKYLPLPPGASLIWGHEKAIFVGQPGSAFKDWISNFGLTFRIKAAFGAPDILVLSDPMGITYLLQKKVFDYHHSAVVRPRVARLLGKGLGWIEGEEEHRRMRRLARPALTSDNIKAMSLDITEAATRVTKDLVEFVQNAGQKAEVNILDWTGKATLNIVGRVAFLHDFKAGNSKEAQDILNARKKGVSAIAKYVGFLTLMLLRRFHFLNYFPIAAIQGQGLAKRTIHAGIAKDLIQRSQTLGDEGKYQDQKDLLTRLLLAASEERILVSELYEHISTFMYAILTFFITATTTINAQFSVAGFESTTTTVGFSVWELARHPEKQRRLREELAPFGREPTYDDLQNKAPYLEAVLKETLRLYPGLPYMERVATKADIIPLYQSIQLANGQVSHQAVVEPGQTVIIPIIAMQRQDSVWGDGDAFRPERWLEPLPPQEQLCSGWGKMLAFSDGPRSCVGTHLAIFNYKVIMSSFMNSFLFEDPNVTMRLKISSSLQAWVHRDPDDPGRNELPVILVPTDN
ncbi:cytochrome P450 [Armillaria gallica]|uniref:Cytochrome P450 n=1 Tax=Armillaria gallica TaxID=47427 RepID=A0A2H3DDL7_ARMGA|nr:cytochrome P450 [Armillaria gallica]